MAAKELGLTVPIMGYVPNDVDPLWTAPLQPDEVRFLLHRLQPQVQVQWQSQPQQRA